MRTRGFVIVRFGDGAFWTGKRWSVEYPNAKQYDNNVRAIQACSDLNTSGESARVIVDYGMSTERRIYPDAEGPIHKWPGSIGG